MLVISRGVGEAFVIGRRMVATLAVIGKTFVELALKDADGERAGHVALGLSEWADLPHGVRCCLLRINSGRARLGLEMPEGVGIERQEIPTEDD